MTTLAIYQVDSFSSEVFKGNPAAVVLLKDWISDEVLLNIALENNLSETAFLVQKRDQWQLRWFTPGHEVPLCGHGTLAAAHVLFELGLGVNFEFMTASGLLSVALNNGQYQMKLPISRYQQKECPTWLCEKLSKAPELVFANDRFIAVLVSHQQVESFQGTFEDIDEKYSGVVLTAKGKDVDFVSRMFGCKGTGVKEDPVTGSTHALLAPFWAKKLGKNQLLAKQLSKRGGLLDCSLVDEQLLILGQARTYLKGKIQIPEVTPVHGPFDRQKQGALL